MESNKGICRLSVVPIRMEPADAAEIGSQLLFGDHFTLLDWTSDRKWVQIEVYFDGYRGWIDSKQFMPISEEYFNQINLSDYRIATDLYATILYRKMRFPVVMGSVIPLSTNELFDTEEHLAFSGETKSLSARRDFEYLKEIAFKYLHAPYLWGGKSPFGIDCSGLTQNVLKICGYHIKRDARDQAKQGTAIDKLSDAKPGDLAFFDRGGRVTHVGIILEDSKIIHASGQVRVDELHEEGIYKTSIQQYTHKLHSIKRFLK
jgi:gamma-D-glutamyl-L-lysine dipeptidyl-peptidase